MNISEPFIRKPVGTTLLTIALALAGVIAFRLLPVSSLPEIDFPTIAVSASLPGASPETMASSVATPLERQFGRIAGVDQLTSQSSLGTTVVVLQFELDRNIDAAARDVQAAINAARSQLPANLPSNPTYRKVNPADAPIMIAALTSTLIGRGEMYDAASSILAQKLSQLQGVGQVLVGGGALPGVRVELNPNALNNYGIGLEQVRTMLANANVNRPKGALGDGTQAEELAATDQLLRAEPYRDLLVAYHNGAAVRLRDVGNVIDSVEDVRNLGLFNSQPAVMLIIFRQPGANIIETVDRIRAALPQLQAAISPNIKISVAMDRTTTIRTSVKDVEFTMAIAIGLVILVVLAFLGNLRATLIPGIVVPLSLVGTFGVMYLLGYSIDNLSLMALTISTGFVVDDAIVVVENVSRHLEQGLSPLEAALKGASEIGFTVFSISISLCAVFIPILLMGGIVGRLFREFAVTLSIAILVSMVISLTTTPMMCAQLLRSRHEVGETAASHFGRLFFDRLQRGYDHSLAWVLRHAPLTLAITLGVLAINIYLFVLIPKGFFPQQDTGRMMGIIMADQDTSFQAMSALLLRFTKGIMRDPNVENVAAFTGSTAGSTNTARGFVALKPWGVRKLTADQVIGVLRKKMAKIPGARLYLQAAQDLQVGGRLANAQYQYTLSSDNLADLNHWAPKLLAQMAHLRMLADVSSDQQDKGLGAILAIDRQTASRLGITAATIDNTLYDAFGQRQVSTMYTQLNQYHVVMEVEPKYWQNPQTLQQIYVRSSTGAEVPLSAFTHFVPTPMSLTVNHQGQFPAVTISFNLAPGVALGQAVQAVEELQRKSGMPTDIEGNFQGTAQAFQASLSNEPMLILAAVISVYIVLGILYESYIHPITILSTLPSAGVGALLALMVCRVDLSVIALIGMILLIGIVKKNAILMIDFALEAERTDNKTSEQAIYSACLLRFRPILMTTMAALLGGLPLALGHGVGAELRRPLGIAIVGGLAVSQMLTLYTTPVVYLYLDRLSLWFKQARRQLLSSVIGPAARPDADAVPAIRNLP